MTVTGSQCGVLLPGPPTMPTAPCSLKVAACSQRPLRTINQLGTTTSTSHSSWALTHCLFPLAVFVSNLVTLCEPQLLHLGHAMWTRPLLCLGHAMRSRPLLCLGHAMWTRPLLCLGHAMWARQSLCLGHTVPLSCCVNHLFVLPLGSLVPVLWEHQQVLFTYCTARREEKTKGEWGGGIRVALLGPGERLTLS